MSFRYGILSLFFLFFVSLLAIKNYEIWTRPVEVLPEKSNSPDSGGKAKKPVVKSEGPTPVLGSLKESPTIESYILVAEKNIFTPDRKEFPIVAPPAAPAEVKKPIVRPQIILYGVTIAGDYQSASISNPGRQIKKGEREIMSLRVGDLIGEYKLAKILPDRIVLEQSEDSFEVLLYDAKAPKQRTFVKTETKPATITSTLPTTAPPPAAMPSPAPAAVPAPSPTPAAPLQAAPRASVPTPQPTPSPRSRRWGGSYGQPQPGAPAQTPQSGPTQRVLPIGPP